ncbi:MAG: hypothetical protein ABGZ35_24470, partial [Planctomycetaceae bacterium]
MKHLSLLAACAMLSLATTADAGRYTFYSNYSGGAVIQGSSSCGSSCGSSNVVYSNSCGSSNVVYSSSCGSSCGQVVNSCSSSCAP